MWNIIEYNQIARGEGVRLFTPCGIFEGTYRGSESVDENDANAQWIVLSDVTFSPACANPTKESLIRMSDANVQLSQIVALDLDNG